MSETLLGASLWDQNIHDQLMRHIAAEEEVLGSYRELATDSGDPDVAYLARFLVEDEERHHQIIKDLAASIRAAADLDPSAERVPHIPLTRRDPEALGQATERLIALEHEDERALKELRRSLKPVASTTLWSLLVETMELDTRKHLAILRAIRSVAAGLPL